MPKKPIPKPKSPSSLTHYPLIIGSSRPTHGKQELIAPATGKTFATVAVGTLEDVSNAVAAAKAAQASWGALTPGERGTALLKWADLLEQNIDHLAALESVNAARVA